MAASRLQRWSVYLTNFNFKIQHIVGKTNINADFLSRLPVDDKNFELDREQKVSYINFIETSSSEVLSQDVIRTESEKDGTVSKIMKYVKSGWPVQNDNTSEIKPFTIRSHELTIENGILMWGYRVVIPSKIQKTLLRELHSTHSGIVKMKSRARSYFWWPSLDKDIENIAKQCNECLQLRPNPPKVPISPWPQSEWPFQRIHIDFMGPFRNKFYFIILDSFSKWIEVFIMSSITSPATIEKLRNYIARFGLPNTIVSDNGRQFISREFTNFCGINKIKLMTIAPYHPQSNGAAENSVKTVKYGLKKALLDPKNENVPIQTITDKFLFVYRSSVHNTTQETPHKRLFGREMKTHFDHLKPSKSSSSVQQNNNQQKKNHQQQRQPKECQRKDRKFSVNETVAVRNYSDNKWEKATIISVLGSKMYLCKTKHGDWRRHANQIIKHGEVSSYNCTNHKNYKSIDSSEFGSGDFTSNITRINPNVANDERQNNPSPVPSGSNSDSSESEVTAPSDDEANTPNKTNQTQPNPLMEIGRRISRFGRLIKQPDRLQYTEFD